MKNKYTLVLSVIFLLALPLAQSQKLTILHTNDMHSMLTGFGPELKYSPLVTGNDSTVGGFARLATIFNQEKSANPESTLIVDAGDFLMGSIFHANEQETGFQIALMKKMGYDAITIGNHEFDYGPEALAKIIRSGIAHGGIAPLLGSNMVFSSDSPKDDELEKLYSENHIKPYVIIERNGLKLGIIGIMGQDADEVAPAATPVSFANQVKTVKKLSKILKEQEKVDLVICLSHSGFYPDPKKGNAGEDIELAQKVDDLDIIISGHTHVKTEKALLINNTIIVQTGAYVRHVGKLELDIKDKKIQSHKFSLLAVDDKIAGDPATHQLIETYKQTINDKYFAQYGLAFDKPIAETSFDLIRHSYVTKKHGNVDKFVADAILYYVNKHSEKADVAIIASGTIREKIMIGQITPADIFRVAPLGSGKDSIPGYALAKIYLTGNELKKLMEVVVMAQVPGDDSYINYSGIKLEVDKDKMMLHKVRKVWLGDEELNFDKSNEKLYSVVASTYLLAFVGEIKKMSKGLVKIVPKDKNGAVISDMTKQVIDFDLNKKDLQEGKTWLALVEYLQSFGDKDKNQLPEIPERYKLKQK